MRHAFNAKPKNHSPNFLVLKEEFSRVRFSRGAAFRKNWPNNKTSVPLRGSVASRLLNPLLVWKRREGEQGVPDCAGQTIIQMEEVFRLIRNKADPNEIKKQLKGKDLSAKDKSGQSILHYSSLEGCVSFLFYCSVAMLMLL